MIFTVGSALSFGWETFKKRPWLFLGATLVIAIAEGLNSALTGDITDLFVGSTDYFSIARAIIGVWLGTLIAMGSTAFYIAAQDKTDAVELSALWHPRPFWKYVGAIILIILVVGAGLVLLVVPGVILMLMFMFAPYVVIDRELGPIDAMKESNRITRGHKWGLLGLALVLGLISIIGDFALTKLLDVAYPYAIDPARIAEALRAASFINALSALAVIAGMAVWAVIAGLAFARAYRVLSRSAPPADATLASKAAAPK